MSMKENNKKTGHESFGLTAEEAGKLLSKMPFTTLKTTKVDPVPTLEEIGIERDKTRQGRLVNPDVPMVIDDIFIDSYGDKVVEALREDAKKYIFEDAIGIRELYPAMMSNHTYKPGPSPRKGGFCGACATISHKDRKKLDSCPECGKSYFKYK